MSPRMIARPSPLKGDETFLSTVQRPGNIYPRLFPTPPSAGDEPIFSATKEEANMPPRKAADIPPTCDDPSRFRCEVGMASPTLEQETAGPATRTRRDDQPTDSDDATFKDWALHAAADDGKPDRVTQFDPVLGPFPGPEPIHPYERFPNDAKCPNVYHWHCDDNAEDENNGNIDEDDNWPALPPPRRYMARSAFVGGFPWVRPPTDHLVPMITDAALPVRDAGVAGISRRGTDNSNNDDLVFGISGDEANVYALCAGVGLLVSVVVAVLLVKLQRGYRARRASRDEKADTQQMERV